MDYDFYFVVEYFQAKYHVCVVGEPPETERNERLLPAGKSPHCMKASRGLHFKTYLLIFLMVIFGPLGNVLLGKGMKRVGAVNFESVPEILNLLGRVLMSGTIWLGIGSLITFFAAYMLVLSWADYSYVQPASSVAYAVVALLAHLMLREVVTPTRWIGVILICMGILVVGHTPPRTTEPN
jgi:hypothetical protein